MKVYRIKISSWTSSFRYPNLISGYQPSLLVPPISTVLGMLNACSGSYLEYDCLELGYYFDFCGKGVDLETIYQVELNDKNIPKNQVKSNVLNREFLGDCRLFLYLKDEVLVNLLKNPCYQLLMGRSGDLASVDCIEELDLLEQKEASKVRGQVVPFARNYLPGAVQALPVYFTNTNPRNNIGTQAYSVIPYNSKDFPTRLTAYRDVIDDKEIDIYFHKLDFRNECFE